MTSGGVTAPGELTGPDVSAGGSRRGSARWLGGARGRGTARPRSARRELTLALVLGVAGAGLIFLSTRQGWAQIRTTPPKPLPASLVTVTGAVLVPYADALTVASLASLAAVLATRRLLRRLTGLLLAMLGAALATSVVSLSRAGAIAAAAANTSPATVGAGSVTQGSTPGSSGIYNVAGASSHVTFIAPGWQVLAVTGAIVLVAAGVLVLWRADRMAVMSSRYDAPSSTAKDGAAVPAAMIPARPVPVAPVPFAPVPHAPAPAESGPVAEPAIDSASLWEALSRGDDPTSAAAHGDGDRTG
jgi:uncharacterized membrane protein (TIGR02234 family)